MGHISRIENEKANPSIEVLRKLITAFEISADYLLNDQVDELAPIEIKDKSLAEKLKLIDELDEKDKNTVINVIEAVLTKKKFKEFFEKELVAT